MWSSWIHVRCFLGGGSCRVYYRCENRAWNAPSPRWWFFRGAVRITGQRVIGSTGAVSVNSLGNSSFFSATSDFAIPSQTQLLRKRAKGTTGVWLTPEDSPSRHHCSCLYEFLKEIIALHDPSLTFSGDLCAWPYLFLKYYRAHVSECESSSLI